jgi:xylulose-5-phosphate/fructose-6-phosphate phosphoketolase
VWKFASVDHGVNPDVYVLLPHTSLILFNVTPSVIVGIGVEVTMEVLAAAALLRTRCPELRVRVVNVTDLMILSPYGVHPHALSADAFDSLFTKDKPIHFNYVGWP